MRKIIAFLVVFASFWVGVNAQIAQENPSFCAPSVPQRAFEADPFLLSSYADDCICYDFTPNITEWRKNFCVDGMMFEERTIEELVVPDCVRTQIRYEDRFSLYTLCRLCENPSDYSGWETVACLKNGVLKKRVAFDACWFDSITDEKKYSDKTQFKVFAGEKCSGSELQLFTQQPLFFVAIVIIIGLFFLMQNKKFIKKLRKMR